MAKLIDFGGSVDSNLVEGIGTNSVTFTMPGNVGLAVESVHASVNNAAGSDTGAIITITDQSGRVIAKQRQSATLDAGATGTATWALRLGGDGSAVTTQHAGYYWSNNTAAAGVVGPGGNTYYTAVWDFMQNQWGADLLDITNQALPKVRRSGLYSFSFQVRLITGHSLMGAYAGMNVEVFTTFNTVPAPLFGNMDIRFPMTIIRDWIYPTSSSAFICTMAAGDSFQGGFYTDQPTLGALYQGFGDASIVMTRLSS